MKALSRLAFARLGGWPLSSTMTKIGYAGARSRP